MGHQFSYVLSTCDFPQIFRIWVMYFIFLWVLFYFATFTVSSFGLFVTSCKVSIIKNAIKSCLFNHVFVVAVSSPNVLFIFGAVLLNPSFDLLLLEPSSVLFSLHVRFIVPMVRLPVEMRLGFLFIWAFLVFCWANLLVCMSVYFLATHLVIPFRVRLSQTYSVVDCWFVVAPSSVLLVK